MWKCSFLYQATPAISGWVNNNIGAIALDTAQNTTLTTLINKGLIPGVATIDEASREEAHSRVRQGLGAEPRVWDLQPQEGAFLGTCT